MNKITKTTLQAAILLTMTSSTLANYSYGYGVIQPKGMPNATNKYVQIQEADITLKHHKELMSNNERRINRLEINIKLKNKEIEQLTKLAMTTSQTVQILVEDIKIDKEKISELMNDKDNLKTTHANRIETIKKHMFMQGSKSKDNKEKIKSLEQKIVSLKKQVNLVETEKGKIEQDSKRSVERLNSLINNNKKTITTLTTAINNQDVQIRTFINSDAKLKQNIDELNQNNKSLKDFDNNKHNLTNDFALKINNLNLGKQTLNKTIQELTEQVIELVENEKEYNKIIKTKIDALKKETEKTKLLTEQVFKNQASTNDKISEKEELIKGLKIKTSANTQKLINEKTNIINQLKTELKSKDQKIAELRNAMFEVSTRVDRIQANVVHQNKIKDEKNKSEEVIEKNTKEKDLKIVSLEEGNNKLIKEKQAYLKERQSYLELINSLKNQTSSKNFKVLKQEIELKNNQLIEVTNRLFEKKDHVKALETQNISLGKVIKAKEDEIRALSEALLEVKKGPTFNILPKANVKQEPTFIITPIETKKETKKIDLTAFYWN